MIEHGNAVLAAQVVLGTPQGKALFKYLFKEFEVAKLPPVDFKEVFGNDRFMDKIGSIRAGQAFFELASEADCGVAGALLAQIQRERYEALRAEFIRENGPT